MLPRLLMPYSFAWPPVECCRGTRPSQAANSRPLLNAAPLPIAATVAVETSGRPDSGDLSQALAGFIFVGDAFDLVADNGDVFLQPLPLLPYLIEQHAHPRSDVLVSIFEDRRVLQTALESTALHDLGCEARSR